MGRIKNALIRWVDKRFKGWSKRPSKMHFYSKFGSDVPEFTEGQTVAADIASSDFKHAHYFESDYYIAVDIDLERLRQGKRNVGDSKKIAIRADARNQIFGSGSLDFVASTHTIYRFDEDGRFASIENAVEGLREGGSLVFNIHSDQYTEELDDFLRSNFSEVEVDNYRNSLSAFYESVCLDSGDSLEFAIQSKYTKYLFWLLTITIALVESVPFPGEGRQLYIRCISKKG